jgi:hypothetical protein
VQHSQPARQQNVAGVEEAHSTGQGHGAGGKEVVRAAEPEDAEQTACK